MASSNRHWPSLFKSKPAPCNPHHHHPWQHDVTPPPPTHRPNSSYNPVGGEERSPEPKPRWNPKPEQIRILEAIFNSGIVNPPRDEIRKIRVQLQEFGQVGDANVFYWFQNRKSRSKHKLRHLQPSKTTSYQPPNPPTTTISAVSSSSSSSSDNFKPSPRSAGSKRTLSSRSEQNGVVLLDPSTTTTHQPSSCDFFSSEPAPFFMSGQHPTGFSFSEPVVGNVVGPCTSLLLSDILNLNHYRKLMDQVDEDHDGIKKLQLDHHHHQICYSNETNTNGNVVTTTSPIVGLACNPVTAPSSFLSHIPVGMGSTPGDHHQESEQTNSSKTTVFINDVAFEVGTGPFNVREAFGDDMLLVHSSGQPVLTDDWGITLQSLNHGVFYYLVPFPSTAHHI